MPKNNLKKQYYNSEKYNIGDQNANQSADKREDDNAIFSTRAVLFSVGGNIRRIRKMYKMSISDLASKANMSSKYLQGVEVGKRNISVTNLSKIAVALNVSTAYLFIVSDSEKSGRLFEISDRLKNYNSSQLESIEKIIVDIDSTENNTEEL